MKNIHSLQMLVVGAVVLSSMTCAADPVAQSPENYGNQPTIATPPPPPPTAIPRIPPTLPAVTPTPVSECPYVQGNINWMGWRPVDYYWGSIQTGAMAAQIPCVAQLAYDIWRACDWVNSQYEDDCYSIALAQRVFVDGYWRTGHHSNGSFCAFSRLGHNHAGSCGGGWFFMDRSCNVVPYSRDFRNLPSSCTFSVSYFESSPISLILDQDSWNDRESTLTKFPLNPADTNSWYTWKASDKAPLLVYDPEHTGKINRAAQLFGEWTFGGQRYAALGSENVRPTPWKDGYEALATLDSNGDEKISGQELTPLALWLDANRDGISQSGEVQPVGDFGITALYFRADRKDEITNSIYASVGYERMINNQKVIGSSVDWYGKAASSPMSFLDQPMSLGIKGEAENTNSALPTIHQDSTDALPESAALASGETAGGLWQWNFDDRKDQNSGGSSGGLLLIRDNASGKKIKGISFVQRELIVSDKVRDDRALGSVNLIEGLKKFDKNGRPVLLFKTIEGGERAKVTSEAVINSDGTMSGTSSAKVAGQSLTYRWTAKRVEKK